MSIDTAFTQFPALTTERLRLRQIVPGDAAAMFAIFGDEETMRYFGSPAHQTIDDTHKSISRKHEQYARREALWWGVTFRDDDQIIGTCNFHTFSPSFARAEAGYGFNRRYWGQGLAFEAMTAMLEYGFAEMDFRRVEATIAIENTASKNLLLRLGFTYEGNLRERYEEDGVFSDEHYFGLLRHEWQPMRNR
jgi:ribosomal-protein-alanine N-acetyltransferase